MDVGPFIKLHRTKQQMKQEDLAKGIVSESYLSKIENQKTNASYKVIQMLFIRLGVHQTDDAHSIYLQQKCNEWFGMLYESSDKKQLEIKYQELQYLIEGCFSDVHILFEIYKVRYFLLIGKKTESYQQLLVLKEIMGSFNDVELFYWYKFVGNYHSLSEDYSMAINMYKQAEEKLGQLDLDKRETADLNYTMAVTYSKLRNTLEVIDYISSAMKYYRESYNLSRCAHGHILLGIAYERIRDFDKAIKNYNLADDISKLNNNSELKRLVNINLGYLHATKRESDLAIDYFEKVLEDKGATTKDQLIAITCLSEEYYHTNELDKKKAVIDRGMSILKKVDSSDKIYQFYHMKLYAHYYILTNQLSEFEQLVIDHLIPYLQRKNDYANLVTYGNLMGIHFEKRKKYKFATHYYKLANKAYEELIQL
ncbi:helix-turn-helix domain-containing protein [Aquibacillus saliphilus]|uniref:helix-turn-helix domain-containing protein n=1 Tax=Aquibacillus saliphilus TaxID=1909422 RepID=UPI001CF0AFB3|nr:helix-turn-helix transcriptional regulator [Aquibacillus saliphilus]